LSRQISPLEPDLTGAAISLPNNIDPSEIDEFGRKRYVPHSSTMTVRNVSCSTYRSNILDESLDGDEEVDEDWTLKLKEADAAHLDDL
jgi:hypothetical protein